MTELEGMTLNHNRDSRVVGGTPVTLFSPQCSLICSNKQMALRVRFSLL